MTQSRILIVDDEEAIRFFLGEELTNAGYAVLAAASGEEALALLEKESVDLILLDLKMAGMDGLQVLEKVREYPLPPVVVMLTAYASVDSAVDALRRGVYDYLRKPCRTEELLDSVKRGLERRREILQREKMIRMIENVARQLQAPTPPLPKPVEKTHVLEERGILLDREASTVTRNGQMLSLTPSEFQLLVCLMTRADRVVSYVDLATALHGYKGGEWEIQDARQALSTHLWRLRRKLGSAPNGEPYIINVRGRGYKFVGYKGCAQEGADEG